MEFVKNAWTSDGDTFRVQMPFAKVDVEQRLVSGFATLDNVDTQGDIVLSDASRSAFESFRGNIREMHQPIAAGRMVDFKEDEFFNADDGKTYKGIFVTVRVSKGAQDTWEKVLDGTLTGFSIGGNITDSEDVWNKDSRATVRIVKGFSLAELSLVDNPANHLANVFSISKAADGSETIKGMIAEVELRNVYWCPEDKVSKNSSEEAATCSFCGNKMQNIGWFENGNDRTEKVREIVTKFLGGEEQSDEGGVESVTVEDKTSEEVEAVEAAPVDEVVVDEPEAEVEAEVVDEAEDTDTDFAKKFDELKTEVVSTLEKAENVTADAVNKFEEKINEVTKAFDEKTASLAESITSLEKSLESRKESDDAVTKRLEALEGETAIKKSADKADDSMNKNAEPVSLFKGTSLSLDRL